MSRKSPQALQTSQDICRAEFMVAVAQGLTRDEGADALRYSAAAQGLSLHAAALAVLSSEPTDELLIDRSSQQTQSPAHRHLYALRSLATEESMERKHEAESTPQRGRHHRR